MIYSSNQVLNTVVEEVADEDYQICNLPEEMLKYVIALKPKKKDCLFMSEICQEIRKQLFSSINRKFPIRKNMTAQEVAVIKNKWYEEKEGKRLNYWDNKAKKI